MPDWSPPIRIRRRVTERAHERCECYLSPAKFAPDPFAVEHILPRSRGGTHQLSNLALSCPGCNSYKGTRIEAVDPVSGQRVPLYHPRKHVWHAHFAWSEDLTHLIGLTPIGRATIAALDLNRPGVVNLRRVLCAFGEHPPPTRDEEPPL